MDPQNMTEVAMTAPASEVPSFIPLKTATQSLPFGDLRWENFERLCYRLAGKDADVESHSLYGRAGQAQQGIDIFARKRNGKYNSWQAKCYKKYTEKDLKSACSTFLSGHWTNKSDAFYIATNCSVDDVSLQDEIERQAEVFQKKGITLKVLGGQDLCTLLRNHPEVVLEFFGRECAKHFFGDSVDSNILLRLDGAEVNKVRLQLQRVYKAGFELLDKIPVNAPTPFTDQHYEPISLLERFSTPDVLLRESTKSHLLAKEENAHAPATPDVVPSKTPQLNKEEGRQSEQYRRTPISNWLAESNQIAIIGHAGSGKSTVLRCLALDLLGEQKRFTGVASKWGRHLPLFISFAKWVRLTESSGEAVSIKELIRATWQQQLTTDLVALIDKAIDESRIILFVDGLDEWANEQAARTTLQAMLTIVSAHNIPIVVSARPGGLFKIGGIPDTWSVGLLAPLSKLQQRKIATKWFSRNFVQGRSNTSNDEAVAWQTNRFFDELHRGRGLETLAETPLLLLGLIALAVRQLVLPINKVQALSQLTDLLLELHPYTRATAAGDVHARFSSTATIDVRREALAALAFEIRIEGGDAGYSIHSARKCIKKFLTDPEGFCFSPRDANEVANEILAVNSETMGLLVEKGPGEIGFVHASLEEYLASVHIHGWPIERIIEFVRENASKFRWRSVFGDLIARNNRRSEAEKIVQVIDEPESDTVGALQRRLLLANVVFGGAEISKPTAMKLAKRSLDIVAGSGWNSERSAHLNASLQGIFNPTLRGMTSEKISQWGIKSADYLQDFYKNLKKWKPTENLLNILKLGIYDENPMNSRAAAQTLATKYNGNPEVETWLTSLIRGDGDLTITGIALEALTVGWPKNSALEKLLYTASKAQDKTLQLSAIWCKVQLSTHTALDLENLLKLAHRYNGVDYQHRWLAGQSLILGWPNEPELIELCLTSVGQGHRVPNELETDIAENYLLSCDPTNDSVCSWILRELESKYPFNAHLNRDLSQLMRFADSNPGIRESLIQYVTSEKIAHREYIARPIYHEIQDPRIKLHLIDKVKTADNFSIFWALAPLVEGWASDSPDVKELIKNVLDWPEARKFHILGLYPQLIERKSCIQELCKIIDSGVDIRSDLLVSAFCQLNVRSNKTIIDKLVTKILSEPDSGFSGAPGLIVLCPDEPRVKAYAFSRLKGRNPPLALLASTYSEDTEFQEKISEYIGSLPVALRQQIVDAAANEYDRNDTAKLILTHYDNEIDASLKIHSAIKNYQALFPNDADRQRTIDQLLSAANVVGHDHDERRAAAFGGLITYGATRQFAPLEWNKKPLSISFGAYGRESQTLLRLIAEKWEQIDEGLEHNFFSRLGPIRSEEQFWSAIAPHLSANTTLKQKFIEYCDQHNGYLEAQQLQSLAKELPKSDLLLRHCLSALGLSNNPDTDRTWPRYQSYFEASYILRDHFGNDQSLTDKMQTALRESNFQSGIAALAIYDPQNSNLDKLAKKILKEHTFSENHVTAIIIATSRFESEQLEGIIKSMINRPNHNLWDFQDRINHAIKSRLTRDSSLGALFSKWLSSNTTESEISSLSRYLASTGKLDQETQSLCSEMLNTRNTSAAIPAHGFDAISDAVRPVVHSLLDVLAGPIH